MIDYEERNFGKIGETKNLDNLRKLCPTFDLIEDEWAPFDYVNDDQTIYLELKTRRNTKDKYPTTMIPNSKIKKIVEGNTYYFAFNFVDGLYYIKYDKEVFDTFEVKKGGRFDRGKAEIEDYIYIPINLLTKLD